jgi:hypothetical protein
MPALPAAASLPSAAPHSLPCRRRCVRHAAARSRALRARPAAPTAAAAPHAPHDASPPPWPPLPRRSALALPLAAAAAAAAALASPGAPALAADVAPLWERLEKRQLDKPIFNAPPPQQVYPDWLEGTWDVTTKFAGYAFPSKRIDKACVRMRMRTLAGFAHACARLSLKAHLRARLPLACLLARRVVADVTTPGFQKLSIMYIPDVGLGGAYQLRFVRRPSDGAVTEDRAFNIPSVVQGFLGAPLVAGVDYAPEKEPNRCALAKWRRVSATMRALLLSCGHFCSRARLFAAQLHGALRARRDGERGAHRTVCQRARVRHAPHRRRLLCA